MRSGPFRTSAPRIYIYIIDILIFLSNTLCTLLAPRTGIEPVTYWLTASCSTAELPRNIPYYYTTLLPFIT